MLQLLDGCPYPKQLRSQPVVTAELQALLEDLGYKLQRLRASLLLKHVVGVLANAQGALSVESQSCQLTVSRLFYATAPF